MVLFAAELSHQIYEDFPNRCPQVRMTDFPVNLTNLHLVFDLFRVFLEVDR